MNTKSQKVFTLKPSTLTLKDVENCLEGDSKIALSPESYSAIAESRKVVDTIVKEDRTVYGINTGFGILANKKISIDKLKELQKRLVLSHAVGVGEFLDDRTTRLILLLKINSLAQGYSGVSVDLVNTLIAIYNSSIYPLIPVKGSVGASGDLAPLAHLSLALMGVGNVRFENNIYTAKDILNQKRIAPLVLKAKEGLALLNGTQVSNAISIIGLMKVQRNFSLATISGALSTDATASTLDPFNTIIAKIKRSVGQEKYSKVMQDLISGSEILSAHQNCAKVQDPYSIRCQPQVMGAILDKIIETEKHIMQEANGVSDNPIVLTQERKIVSGGNFHAEAVAINSDILSIICAEIGSISERRIAMMIDHNISGLPHFLVKEAGLNSGFMIAHVTAAALASENKTLSHPASVDTIPTSANQEDHVSMATFAARKMNDIADNVLHIIAIETLAACQGIDLRKPLKSSSSLINYLDIIRTRAKFYTEDRLFTPDINNTSALISERRYYNTINDIFFSKKDV